VTSWTARVRSAVSCNPSWAAGQRSRGQRISCAIVIFHMFTLTVISGLLPPRRAAIALSSCQAKPDRLVSPASVFDALK
jgi:hypothetical protein